MRVYHCILILFSAAILFLTNCKEEKQSVGLLESGTITVYTALEDELVTEYLESFNKKYPNIKVNIVRESTGIITARLLAE